MASKVNTRFVIILVVGVIALFGLLMLAYSIVYKSPADLAKRGDEFMAQGEYRLAEKAYSKAVNKDATNTENLEKWIDSMGRTIPETPTEYVDRFYGDYINAIRSTSTILRRDIDAHERYLTIGYDLLNSGYGRPRADSLIQDTTKALAYFDGSLEGVQEWERLKRFRGMAILEIARRDELLEDDQYPLAVDDLERALAAMPDNAEVAIAEISMKAIVGNKELKDIDFQGRIDVLDSGIALADAFLQQHPNNIDMLIQKVYLNVNRDRQAILMTLPQEEQAVAIAEAFALYHEQIESIGDLILSSEKDQLNIALLKKFYGMENTIARQSNLATTRQLIDSLVDNHSEDAETLMLAGKIAKDVGDTDEALGWFAQVDDLKTQPLSYTGLRQYEFKRQALQSQATIRIDRALSIDADATDQERESIIAQAIASRDRYAGAVTEEELILMLLDGKLARAQGDLDNALRLFKRFNEQTQRLSSEGLWQEGGTASQLGQYGIARKAFRELIPIDNSNRKLFAMLSLARIDEQLQDFEAAATTYNNILDLNPNVEAAINGLENANRRINPELNDDPELVAIYTSRKMRQGTSDIPADYAGAIELLRNEIIKLDYSPRITQELASLLFDSNDIENARVILSKSLEKNPDDEMLQRMVQAASSSDSTDILIEMIRLSDRQPIEKLLGIARIAADRDRPELLETTLAELNTLDPENKQVIEMSFIGALKTGDTAKAQELSDTPNLSATERLSFQARLAASQNELEKAVTLLNQAVASGVADASVFQMLAVFHRELGNPEQAIQAFESSLAIRPDNSQTITEYVLTLIQSNRYEDALSTARRLQRYATSNPTFMSLWLNLESVNGGEQGRDFAIRQRERMLELNPTEIENRYQLARMYIASKEWEKSRVQIDYLRDLNDQLVFVELDALWHADQGVIDNADGVAMANNVFAKYIEGLEQPVGSEPYVLAAEFMIGRGRADLAVLAATEAEKHQSSDTMLGSKLLGDLYTRINNLSEAVKAFNKVIENDADPDYTIHYRLVETLTRLGRFEEANAVFAKLPEDKKSSMISMILAADIATGLGDRIKAGSLLDDAVSQHPNQSYVYIKRAESMIGDETLINDLLSDVSRAIDLRPDDWRAYRVRAAGYLAIDRREDALKDLKATIRLNPALDKSIFSVLNELMGMPGRSGEALDFAREAVSRRPDDATLMARMGGLFSSRGDWSKASELYKMAWDKRHSVNDGAVYIDSLVRKSPPDAKAANEVITELSKMVGDINESAGLLAAQALVLQARGRDDFAQQQMTKAFNLAVNDDGDLINWAGNLSRYFEGQGAEPHVTYLEALKRRNTNPEVNAWLDLFIGTSLVQENGADENAYTIFKRLQSYTDNKSIQLQAFQIHGSSLFAEDRFEDAAAVWEMGLESFSDDWGMNNNLAYVYSSKLDRLDDSLAFGQKALDKNIARSEAYETMAGIYIQLEKLDEAEQMIQEGSLYIRSIESRVTMLLTAGRLEIARGNLTEARSKLNDARSVLRASPTAYPNLEKDIDTFEAEFESAQG